MKVENLLLQLAKFGGKTDVQQNDIECVKFATQQLEKIGCKSEFKIFQDTGNVLTTIGSGKKSICFCGHCDVVPTGMQVWSKDPCGEIVEEDGVKKVYCRGAVDMLGGNACWIVALSEIIQEQPKILEKIQINTLLTGAEEGKGENGTVKMVEYLKDKNTHFDACIVGEPTSEYRDAADIDQKKLSKVCCGRQGYFSVYLTIHGKSGHSAYKDRFDNPIKKAIKLCNELYKIKWNEHTNLEIVSFDAENSKAENVILSQVKLICQIRFYDITANEVEEKVFNCVNENLEKKDYSSSIYNGRIGYKTPHEDKFLQLVLKVMKNYNADAYTDMCNAGTDAEYMTKITTSVCELGLKAIMMHQPDEYTTSQDLEDLKNLYKEILVRFAEEN